jgi:hypothetical protein
MARLIKVPLVNLSISNPGAIQRVRCHPDLISKGSPGEPLARYRAV